MSHRWLPNVARRGEAGRRSRSRLSAVTAGRAEAFIVPVVMPLAFANRDQVTRFAQRNRLPSIYGAREFVDAGGLMAYGPSIADGWRRAATYVDKILKGAQPGELAVEQPTRFELVINLKTAKVLGITIRHPAPRRPGSSTVE